MARIASALHQAADSADAAQTRKELSRLDGLLELIRAQYPAGALDASNLGTHEGHLVAPVQGHEGHEHGAPPAGLVDSAPATTLRIEALDALRFEPRRLVVQSGVPTRIEVVNAGAIEHSLFVKTPDGDRDWVHIHVSPRATEGATYRLDAPGTYAVLCTVPGHTEGGMVGELVVLAGKGDHR